MLLKDAFRYQNFLSRLYDETRQYLLNPYYTTTVTETHMRKKANADAIDETIVVARDKQVEASATQLIHFAYHLLEERSQLTYCIAEAKHNYKACDYDAELESNRNTRELLEIFKSLSGMKSTEDTHNAYDTKFNVNGDQVRYMYEVKSVTTIDYDRNQVKRMAKHLAAEADKISEALDRAKVECEVHYTPKYDVNDTFEDVLQAYLSD